MVSKIEPDRYADTGFSVKDTPPEVNAELFARMMAKTPAQRMVMGFTMTETARALVWASLPSQLSESERRRAFYERFHGEPLPPGA